MADQHVVTTTATKNADVLSGAVSTSSHSSSDEVARERETLLLMLLGQVCSLHDATPRTFVVHVIALYERGILESSSVRLLVDIGLIPRPREGTKSIILAEVVGPQRQQQHRDCEFTVNDDDDNSRSYDRNDTEVHDTRQGGGGCGAERRGVREFSSDNSSSLSTLPYNNSNDEGAIVPYHDSDNLQVQQQRFPGSELLQRQQEALAIREHLEQMHESSSIGSSFAHHGTTTASSLLTVVDDANNTTPSLSTSTHHPTSAGSTSNNYGWNRANTQSTLTSFEESFDNPPLQQQQYLPPRSDDGAVPTPSLSTREVVSGPTSSSTSSSSSSWSVEHHPLSLSRYQREFIQISLLATGSFGSVYHAIHKLESPQPYAIKCVTFATRGYYANTLSLVMREVRILAKLDHPNCVRYYTSWLEPSWMTGGNSDDNNIMLEEEDDEEGEYDDLNPINPLLMNRQHTSSSRNSSSSNPKLLTDIDRVLDGLQKSEEIEESVSQLEAILYGDKCDDDNDDGFDWTVDSPTSERSVLSLRPLSHRYSRGTSGGDNSEEGSRKWTQDHDGERNNSYHNSKVYANQRSLENRYLTSPTTTSSSYRYQISMYIQMQLCNPRTLADWISDRNNNSINDNKYDEEKARSAIEIFNQIVSGLAHVHSKGIIHRDLKPANIFSGDDGTFMIGDFGLSKMISDANNNEHSTGHPHPTNAIIHQHNSSNGHHTVGVGTASYASPEQISSKNYGPASDIYSLGLILLELIGNFTSEHERAKAFHDCRYKREVMPWLCQEYPEISLLILSCTEIESTRRPLAGDILAAELVTNEGTRGGHMVQNLKLELSLVKMDVIRKDNVIESQAEQLKEKDDIIENLNRRLAHLESRIAETENEGIPLTPPKTQLIFSGDK